MTKTVFTQVAHNDHRITEEQLNFVQTHPDLLALPKDTHILQILTLPPDIKSASCDLWGPSVGDDPIEEALVFYQNRGARRGPSRMIKAYSRLTRYICVIGIKGDICFTIYGTRADKPSPKEPWNASTIKEHAACVAWWSKHALVPTDQKAKESLFYECTAEEE